ncbi:MAG: NAD(+) synthase [Eubacterium sp.]|nr:NAD(+) synthase [Eubacterium sp.]
MFDFYRVAACVPDVSVGNTEYNLTKILEKLEEAYNYSAGIITFPELAITGYSCQDLFFQDSLLTASKRALKEIIDSTSGRKEVVIVGGPLIYDSKLYNAAYVIKNSKLLGIAIKTYIPNHNEFYEKRWFSSARDLTVSSLTLSELGLGGDKINGQDNDYIIPIGNNIIFDIEGSLKFGVEICEDLWGPMPPSNMLALGGAELIVNLSASNETIAKREYRKGLVRQQSASLITDYLYVSAGSSESTQDLIFSGHSLLCENGSVINENREFIANDYIMIADMDLGKIRHDRMKSTTFTDSVNMFKDEIRKLIILKVTDSQIPCSDGKYILVNKTPFIPSTKARRLKRCNEIFDMQVGGLVKRLQITGSNPVVGVSGGMDSTLALLVAARALEKLDRDPDDLIAITMPAFGTSDRTYNNSLELINALGTEPLIIDIKKACIQHLEDIGHDGESKDAAYENTQARERTQVLMDYANMENGIVIGTGDLSELALGWCTYNGDQMSMYGVNGSIPKTLVRWMIDAVVENDIFPEASDVLRDILDTPISPELLPPDEEGKISQKTEDKIGPYELHDFFIYYSMRFGYSPAKIYFLAKKAFEGNYSEEEIKKWMTMFYRRFFTQQFKRSCMPDGVKVGSVSFSPRGDLRMPSDASYNIWMKELENL